MQDLLAQGAAWLARKRREHCAKGVTISRPSTGSVRRDVPATRGRQFNTIDQGDGSYLQIESDDFIIAPADYKLDGMLTEPLVGDRITDCEDYIYEVLPLGGGGQEPCWRWVDAHRKDRRIHVKLIESPGGPT